MLFYAFWHWSARFIFLILIHLCFFSFFHWCHIQPYLSSGATDHRQLGQAGPYRMSRYDRRQEIDQDAIPEEATFYSLIIILCTNNYDTSYYLEWTKRWLMWRPEWRYQGANWICGASNENCAILKEDSTRLLTSHTQSSLCRKRDDLSLILCGSFRC